MKKLILPALLITLFIAQTASAWGAVTHTGTANRSITAAQAKMQQYGLQLNTTAYLAGAIAPDIYYNPYSMALGCNGISDYFHTASFGRVMFERERNNQSHSTATKSRIMSFAMGWLSHDTADLSFTREAVNETRVNLNTGTFLRRDLDTITYYDNQDSLPRDSYAVIGNDLNIQNAIIGTYLALNGSIGICSGDTDCCIGQAAYYYDNVVSYLRDYVQTNSYLVPQMRTWYITNPLYCSPVDPGREYSCDQITNPKTLNYVQGDYGMVHSVSDSTAAINQLPDPFSGDPNLPNCHEMKCTPTNKCGHGYGDCDTNNDCIGSVCEYDVGSYYGCTAWVDVCVSPPSLLQKGKTYTKKCNSSVSCPSGNYPDTNNAELTDGKYASNVYTNSNWVGFGSLWTNPFKVNVTVDLGKTYRINALNSSYLDGSANVDMPSKVEYYCGSTATSFTRLGNSTGSTSGGIARYPLWGLNADCRYLRLTATRGGDYWIFTDEFEIWGRNATPATTSSTTTTTTTSTSTSIPTTTTTSTTSTLPTTTTSTTTTLQQTTTTPTTTTPTTTSIATTTITTGNPALPKCHNDKCTPTYKCSHGYGDCDTNNDCVNSECQFDVGAEYGCGSTVDICV
jgi:hypothetical protein